MRLYESLADYNGIPPEGHIPALRYVRDCMQKFTHTAISNVSTQFLALDTGPQLFPVSVNQATGTASNSYVVSPLSMYSRYAKYELDQLHRAWLSWSLGGMISVISKYLHSARIDRIVQINNWLLSTNIYPPDWHGEDIADITDMLVEIYPDHALCFRSLNQYCNPDVMAKLKQHGYISVPSRQVYLFDACSGDNAGFTRHHNFRLDNTLLKRTHYRIVPGRELQQADYQRIEQLYRMLYIEKYCPLNPQFTSTWLARGQSDGWLELVALRSQAGLIDGVVGWVANQSVLTAPIVGYDTGLPQNIGLYRLLTQLCLKEAIQRRVLLNFSSGAAHFKRLRGGRPEIEYSMVYVRHLRKSRQLAWMSLGKILSGIGVPLMKSMKL